MQVFQNVLIQSLPGISMNLIFLVVHPVVTNDTHSVKEEM